MQIEITSTIKKTWNRINQTRKNSGFPPLNFPLFVKVRNRIDLIPESYYQGIWCGTSSESPCGTTACIAGEAIICNSANVKAGVRRLWKLDEKWDVMNKAAQILGLGDGEAAILFDGDAHAWPTRFRRMFIDASARYDFKAQAEVAVEYLDYIIRTGDIAGELDEY